MYRIFHGKHLLILSTKDEDYHDQTPDFIFKKPKEEQIKEALKVSKSATKALTILFLGKPDKILKRIMNEFKLIEAAGGLVFNDKNELLFIKRLGKWDLPKGKIKKDEDLESCAMREVEEETGASGLSILAHLTETYHTYFRNNKWIIKKSYWYIMKCDKGDELVPQLEEDITKVKWKSLETLDLETINTYPAISWIISEYLSLSKI
ncbi:NUDIX domain-containing protein [bacterium]|nr:NUDIX domain-containing protein [bacterium]